MSYADASEATKATYWYPILAKTDLPIPKSILVEMACMEEASYRPGFDREELRPDGWQPPTFDPLKEAIEELGTPCFVRSDLSSAKHQGLSACKVEDIDSFRRTAWDILRHHEMDFLGVNPTHWMVRSWIEMDARTEAFGREGDRFPLPPEYRVFATSDGEVLCSHFYWPRDELRGQVSVDEDVLAIVDEMEQDTQGYVPELEEMGAKAASHLDRVEIWSVDFALAKAGWYLIDVADARISWRPEGCPHCNDIYDAIEETRT